MSLSQIDLRAKFRHECSAKFNKESWCIAELYWSFLRDYQVGKVKKCLIIVSDDWGDAVHNYTSFKDSKEVNLEIDFEKYFSYSNYERKKVLLRLVHSGMMSIASKETWEVDSLLDVFNLCVKADLNYKFLVQNKLKASPNRKYKLGLWCEWDIDEFKVFWLLMDRNNKEIKRGLFINESPSGGEFIYYVNFKWVSNDVIVINDEYRAEKRIWEIKID